MAEKQNVNSNYYYDRVSHVHYVKSPSEGLGIDSQLPVISLFTGAGGMDIGLEEAGFTTAACVEYDSDCRETLRKNRPSWKLFEEPLKNDGKGGWIERVPGDIRDVDVDELLEFAGLKKGEAALVVGGAPCQPFSNIGKKLGASDEKNGDLFLEFVRIVKGVSPHAFIFENVVGITQKRHSSVIDYMLEKFRGLGYGLSHTVLNAANYGVPQRRERFFIIGIKGVDKPAFPLPSHFKSKEHFDGFNKRLDKPIPTMENEWVSVKDAFAQIPVTSQLRSDYKVMKVSQVVKDRMKLIGQGKNFKVLPLEMRPDCWKNGKHQGNDTFGRIVEDLPSCTIRTAAYNPAKGQYIHPTEDRGLNTIEMATLQSFPQEWRFHCSHGKPLTLVSGGKQIGNAVPPALAKAIANAILIQMENIKAISFGIPIPHLRVS